MERLLERQHRRHPNHDSHLHTPPAQIQRSSPLVHDKRHLYSQRNGKLRTAHQQDPRRRLAEDGTYGAKQHTSIPQQQVRYEHDDARCVKGKNLTESSQEVTDLVIISRLEWYRMLKEDGVKVWCISPGFLATGLGGNQEANKNFGAGDPATAGHFVRSVLEGYRDGDVGRVINRDGVQPW